MTYKKENNRQQVPKMVQWQYSTMCTELDRSIDLMKTFGRFCRIAACEDGNNAVELKAYLAAKTVGRGRAHQAA